MGGLIMRSRGVDMIVAVWDDVCWNHKVLNDKRTKSYFCKDKLMRNELPELASAVPMNLSLNRCFPKSPKFFFTSFSNRYNVAQIKKLLQIEGLLNSNGGRIQCRKTESSRNLSIKLINLCVHCSCCVLLTMTRGEMCNEIKQKHWSRWYA